MTPEELDEALRALPPRQARDALPAPGAAPEHATGVIARAYQAMAPGSPGTGLPTAAQRDARRSDAVRAHRTTVKAAMAELEPRMHRRLLEALKAGASPSAVLLGPTGIGKTAAARWIAEMATLTRFRHMSIRNARELGSAERRHPLGEGYPAALREAREGELLALDDLGTEEERDIGAIQDLFEARYCRNAATFITTGLTKKGLLDRYGAATVRRMLEQHAERESREEREGKAFWSGATWPVLIVDLHEVKLAAIGARS
jgi:hypothetical protein